MTLADVIAAITDAPDVTELVAAGGPADVTLTRGDDVRGLRVSGYTSVADLAAGDHGAWTIVTEGEPLQFGVRVRGVGVVWAAPEV